MLLIFKILFFNSFEKNLKKTLKKTLKKINENNLLKVHHEQNSRQRGH